ncbi:hypothetical protein SH591_04940 [Sphingomonas sp. LY54]|uniref:hypothetical protein n=1 Tax=Sphingomonas sp. LY54 TaxID=3095343 RepID=UPI002D79EFF9|nr:hypothetical protein [Sphingomonas sp. LY54]WRP29530.1 hypothetical protein SH591_04940 [Sphingomonas sp. LY54]
MSRNAQLGLSLVLTAFILGIAFYTGNSGLYILAGLAAGSAIALWQRRRTA